MVDSAKNFNDICEIRVLGTSDQRYGCPLDRLTSGSILTSGGLLTQGCRAWVQGVS
jgi:hypothetical protein